MRRSVETMKRCVLVVFGWLSWTGAWFPDEYPDYCSKDMSRREIPPLKKEDLDDIQELVQVQTVIRHGARTPFTKYSCWKDYDVKWDFCNVTEIMYTSPSPYKTSPHWLFRKKYDGSPNFLGGHCKTGQLLEEGYKQESTNGKILRKAYIGNDKNHLFRSHMWDANDEKRIYFRSDDSQRTLMSGQSLVHSFFEIDDQEVVDWHTGDYKLDALYPNSLVCPRLDNISKDAFSSSDYRTSSIILKRKMLEPKIDALFGKGYWHWSFMMDCIMTTLCTDRELPDKSVTGDVQMTNELLFDLISQQEFDYSFMYLFKDSLYSKLAMSNAAFVLRSNIENAMNGKNDSMKFALFAGHDTTIMPLLAALPTTPEWNGKWVPYGSMISFELYKKSNQSKDFLFRIIYNGQELVLENCSKALCSISVLLKALEFGKNDTSKECAPIVLDETTYSVSTTSSLLTPVLLTALFSSIASAFCTAKFLTDNTRQLTYSQIDSTGEVEL